MFGSHLKLDIRGASHARAIRFALENFPADFRIDTKELAAFMERRAPGRDKLSTQRHETDEVVFAKGVKDGITTGAPIRGLIENRDMRPADYGAERTVPRPGHADFGQWVTMGRIPTGGGKNSGRLTAALCAAGGICKQWLERRGICVGAGIEALGGIWGGSEKDYEKAILAARKDGDSVGGLIDVFVIGLPIGLGGPLFDGLETALSSALFAIPGVKGVSFGSRPDQIVSMRGSEYNDPFCVEDGVVATPSVRQGGILGGRISGLFVSFTVAMRPTPTVYVEQDSVDLATMKPAKLAMKGRHDPCIVRRAVPVVEAVTAFVLADAILADEAAHPRICLTLTGKTLAEDVEQYKSQRYFTDMVELRVDLLKKTERAKVALFPKMLRTSGHISQYVPVILTYRRKCDGGEFEGPESERLAFFSRIFNQAIKQSDNPAIPSSFAYVDFEEDFGDAALIEKAHAAGAKVVRSLHDFTGPVKNLSARLKMLAAAGDIVKVAFMPRSLKDVSRLFEEDLFSVLRGKSAASPLNCIVLAMGPMGLATRVLAGRLGAPWTYASVGGLEGLGHVTPHELVRDYRFRTVTREAALYGVTGWPLRKTRSPELHNAAFAAEDEDALMIPFPAKTAREAIGFMRAMGMRGLAVTIPHKFGVMPLLDRVEANAQRIGAVNTVADVRGRLIGFNTDIYGFAEALLSFTGPLDGRSVAVLGDGGAAQAVKAALKQIDAKFKVFHRATPPQGCDILVNATPVDPIPDYVFTGKELVYDLGYVPEVTPLMARAAKAGCRVENGFRMLAVQARYQRELWENGRE